jgi:hypothetical protein
MTRTGKIARLPRNIRHTLNTRLDDGEQAKLLVDWLNSLEPVRSLLASDFAGRPINEQNLSEWKQGGFLDWQRQQAACQRVRSLVELSDSLDSASDDQNIPDRLASILAAELAAETQSLLESTSDPTQRWQYMCDALRQLNALRRGEHSASRAALERARWQLASEQLDDEHSRREIDQFRDAAVKPLRDNMLRSTIAAIYGKGKRGRQAADYITDINRISHGDPLAPDQASIKPDQTKSD